MLSRISRCLIAAAAVGIMAGCAASGPTIRVNSDPGVSVASLKTFNYFNPLGTDRAGYESIVSQNLKDATTRQLTSLGYQLSDKPDFLVNFGANLSEQLKVTTTPNMGPPVGVGYYGGYYGYRGGYYDPWGSYGNNVDVNQYTEGTVNIDIVETSAKKLIWESVAVGKVTDKVRDNVPAAIQKLVPAMLAQFPVQGGGAMTSAPKN